MRNPKRTFSLVSLVNEQPIFTVSNIRTSNKKRRTSKAPRSSRHGIRKTKKATKSKAQKSSRHGIKKTKKVTKSKAKKPVAKEDLKQDEQTEEIQIRKKDSLTSITNEVNDFVCVLYKKKLSVEKGPGVKSSKNLISECKTGNSLNGKAGNTDGGKDSVSDQGEKTVPSKTSQSDMKFKVIRNIMFS